MIYLKLLVTLLFWGTTYVLLKQVLAEVSISTLLLTRCFFASITIFLFIRDTKWILTFIKHHWPKILFLSLTGITVNQGLQAYSLSFTSANHAGWLVSLNPIVVAFVMVVFFKERLGFIRSFGFLLGVFGVLTIFLSTQYMADGSVLPTSKGDVIFMTTSVLWVAYVIPFSRWFKNIESVKIVFLVMLFSWITVLPAEILNGSYKELFNTNLKTWCALIYLGVFCSGVAFTFYAEGVEKLGASKAASFTYLQPFITSILSYFIVGEQLSKETFIGGFLVISGVYMVNVGQRHVKKFMITLIRYFTP